MISTLKKKKRRARESDADERERGLRYLSLAEGTAKGGGGAVKEEPRGREGVRRAWALIDIVFSSLLSPGASVSVMLNGVIKGINLGEPIMAYLLVTTTTLL